MDEQLDNDLKNRIREVFEHYDEPSADEGWEKLREKFPEVRKNRRAILWFWAGAAAVLLMFLGIGLWITYEHVQPKKFTYKKSGAQLHENLTALKEQPVAISKQNAAAGKTLAKIAKNPLIAANASFAKLSIKKLTGPGKPAAGVTSSLSLHETAINNTFLAKNSKNTDSTKIAANKIPAQTPPGTIGPKRPQLKEQQVTQKPRAKSISDMFAENPGTKTKADTEKIKRVRFSIYEATYFNYAKGSDNNINVGTGFTTDIKISKNLKLVTGLAISQNSLNFNGNVPVISQNNFPASALASAFTTIAVAAPAYYGLNDFSPATALKDYSASLVGLDIPVNLKYEFNPKKNSFYFSAGFSSGTFINETYNYQYSYAASSAQFNQQTENETTNKSFSSFYFAKTLNFSFGAGLPFGKNRVVIEPFLKYPIGGLGYQDIRFGAGGINLKFNFQSAK